MANKLWPTTTRTVAFAYLYTRPLYEVTNYMVHEMNSIHKFTKWCQLYRNLYMSYKNKKYIPHTLAHMLVKIKHVFRILYDTCVKTEYISAIYIHSIDII